jgi:hypothetical protein
MSPLIESIPDPSAIQRRLGELAREEAVLRRLLRVALDAREARQVPRRQTAADRRKGADGD